MRISVLRHRASVGTASSGDVPVPKRQPVTRRLAWSVLAVVVAVGGRGLALGGSASAASSETVGATTLSNIELNGTPGTVIDVTPGTSVTISAHWSDTNTTCRGCVDYLAVGLAGHNNAGCIENPGGFGGSGTASVDLGSVPTALGTYDVVAQFEEQYSCGPTWTAGASTGYQVIAEVVVSTTSAPSLTVRRIFGATADATAAAELASSFPSGQCPGTTGARPVVLATDQRYPDALSSSYLASYLGTGTLLTPTGSLSTATKMALQREGITHVYVVGGPLAISTAVVSAIDRLPAYACGGATETGGHIVVSRIAGATEYTTAEAIADTPPESFVGTADLSGAYQGVNATGGNGLYNTTAGKASTAPSALGALKTAILATGTSFHDAESAATLAYADHMPILLTAPASLSAQAQAAIGRLDITQVIVMGGQLAVSDTVVSQLQALGVSVLRVAATDYMGTSINLAELETGATGAGFGWDKRTAGLAVARGDAFSDGLAGAVATGHGIHSSGPIPLLLIENPVTLGTDVTAFFRHVATAGIGSSHSPLTYLVVLGGPDAVAPSVLHAIESRI